jgi:succinyl-diaminopimelate desuccinylase
VTTIDTGNPTTNLIPAHATAGINIRFNDSHTSKSLTEWVKRRLDAGGKRYTLDVRVSGEAFLTPPGELSEIVSGSVDKVLGCKPQLSTTGGTSDARFIRAHAPVIEFGLVGLTMHKVDERAAVADIRNLAAIYEATLDRFFAA